MTEKRNFIGQIIAYLFFAGFLGVLSNYPTYSHTTADQATIKLTMNHSGKLKEKCRQRSEEEMAKLPPNMRVSMDCPRERSPIKLEMIVDGKEIYKETLLPFGLTRDGEATAYRRFNIKAGEHRVQVRMKDDVNTEGYDYHFEQTLTLAPSQVMVIHFDNLLGKFVAI
ncbi:MAG: hypothetical protein OEY67_03735 [Gammaproteobacteria bacterium]|nr:hypothetical protein [Gammaproteobacteria bacterium]